eukprot:TRINITY_DN76061_c0_g1_i1.p1 TRINITY_DN76061_c0_g1~~TRINITY_DN76061_c0_g1_i1.p1  ORF type:complete len:401 (+),score=64.96 TRINITY_DN76061_c0_g1_i1:99-1205(+)
MLMVPGSSSASSLRDDPAYASDAEKPLISSGVLEDDLEEIEIDIPEDAYGAGILAIVRDISIIREGKWTDEECQLKLIQALFALALLALNLVLQLALLAYIHMYVVKPSVKRVQSQIQQFHGLVFDDEGNFLADAWANYKGKSDLCQLGMSDPFFYKVVVFLWVLLIIRELRTTERLSRDLLSMPRCEDWRLMCRTTADKVQVVALTPCTKFLLINMICIPKGIICIALMWLGCQWLTATTSFTDLVMNSIAMEFVTYIDENLYITLLPVAHRQQVSEINFLMHRKASGQRTKLFQAFRRSFVYLFMAVVFVILYPQYVQTVLPNNLQDLKVHCKHIVEDSERNLCKSPFYYGSFGLSGCFPYGPHAG